jgi:phospholipid/cholesterol/gamma-HCH transport system ATP-binding protein
MSAPITSSPVPHAPAARRPLIEVHDLTVGWADEPPLVEHASFEIYRGEIFAILGKSGSGKSTTMRCIIGLERPIAGTVWIAGIGTPRLEAGRPKFGVMFQDGALIGSMTVGQNVALPLERWTDLPRDAVEAVVLGKLSLVDLVPAIHKLPAEISGGMRKRAGIARAMALEPSLIFLDEPSSGLDPVTAAELDQLIATLRADLGLTVVLVTHDLGSIFAIADRCILIDPDARAIIAAGDPRELRNSSDPRVRAFFNRMGEE